MLGTVQFGTNYGISNLQGQTPINEVGRILSTCLDSGINYIDTASLYGNCEEVLGRVISSRNFKLVTKTAHLTECVGAPDILPLFSESLRKLGCEFIHGLLFHNADALTSSYGKALYSQAENLRSQGMVEKIGVSIYCAEQIDFILANFDVDLIQLPVNVLDQRLIQEGYLKKLKRRGVEIHSRSAFLQGLLLMEPEQLNPYFTEITPLLQRWRDELREKGISALSAALGFLKGVDEIDRIVVGVNNAEQLNQLISVYDEDHALDCSSYAISDVNYLDPSKWRLQGI